MNIDNIKNKFNRKNLPSIIVYLSLFISLLAIFHLTKGQTITIKHDNIILHSQRNTLSKEVAKVSKGDKIPVLKEKNGWIKTRNYKGKEGWLASWWLEADSITNDKEISAKVLNETPIYATKNTDQQPIADAKVGSMYQVECESDGWSQIVYEGRVAYLKTKDLEMKSLREYQTYVKEKELKQMKEEEIEEASNTVIARSSDEALLDQPSLYANIIDLTTNKQKFKLLEIEYNQEEDEEFYKVEDEYGQVCYIESRIASRPIYSLNHRSGPVVSSLSDAIIVIDPGHGGEDSGAVSESGVNEKETVLKIGLMLKEALEEKGATVHLTRQEDTFVELSDRVDLSNEVACDVFISLHFDISPDPDWSGIISYYYHEEDENLAIAMSRSLEGLAIPNLGVKFGDYQVLRENESPALLLELGYLTNENDLEQIVNPKYHKDCVNAIVKGLEIYFSSHE